MDWWKRRSENLDDEIRRHIDLETQENLAAGMSPAEARRAALKRFGSIAEAREESREIWGWLWLERLWQDLRHALAGGIEIRRILTHRLQRPLQSRRVGGGVADGGLESPELGAVGQDRLQPGLMLLQVADQRPRVARVLAQLLDELIERFLLRL